MFQYALQFSRYGGKKYVHINTFLCGPGSVVGIATGYGLDGPGIESRPGTRISAPVQTGPGAHPASCTVGTGSFPGVEAAGAWDWPPPTSSAKVLEKVAHTLRAFVAYKKGENLPTYQQLQYN